MGENKDSYLTRTESFSDKLLRFYREPGKFTLTQEEEKHWLRINFADDLLRQLHPVKTVSRLMMAKYKDECTIATAYRDIALAKKIFGYQPPEEKVYMARLMVEKLSKQMKCALVEGDNRGVAALSKEIREWMGKETDIDPKLVKGNTYIFNIGGKTTMLESDEEVNAEVLETIMNDGDIFGLDDEEFIKKLNE